jgi:hypothetical protein
MNNNFKIIECNGIFDPIKDDINNINEEVSDVVESIN